MKTTLSLLVLLTSAFAFAAPAASSITKNDVGLYGARVTLSGVSVSVPKCPINAMCAPMAYANVVIHLGGCLDRVATVSSNVTETKDGKAQLNISAIAMKNKQSASVKCFAAPTETRQILVQGGTFAAPETVLNDLNANQ